MLDAIKRLPRTNVIIIGGILVTTLVLGFASFAGVLVGITSNPVLKMPNVTELELSEAKSELKNSGIASSTILTDYPDSTRRGKWIVCEQYPSAGDDTRKAREIILYVDSDCTDYVSEDSHRDIFSGEPMIDTPVSGPSQESDVIIEEVTG